MCLSHLSLLNYCDYELEDLFFQNYPEYAVQEWLRDLPLYSILCAEFARVMGSAHYPV